MVWYSHLLKNFPQFIVIHTVKVFSIVNEAEVDVFLEFFCFFYDVYRCWPFDLWSSAFSKSSLYTWKFSVHVLLRPRLKVLSITLLAPGSSIGKDSTCNVGDLHTIPGLGRSPGEGKGYPFQYSGLENSMDCIVHKVTKSQT